AALQCRKLGVDLRLGVAADLDGVLGEAPEVVILATGAQALKPEIPGIDDGYSAWEVLQGTEVPGDRILVIDEEYGFQAPGVAEYLLDRGKAVDIVTSERSLGSFLGATTAPPIFRRLFSKGIQLHCNLKVVQLQANEAVAVNVWSE